MDDTTDTDDTVDTTDTSDATRTDRQNPIARLLTTYARPYAGRIVAGVFALLIARVLWSLPPVILGVAVDAALTDETAYRLAGVPAEWVPDSNTGQLFLSAGLMGGAYLGGSLVYLAGDLLRVRAAFAVQHDLRREAYRVTQELDLGFFERRGTGEIMSVLNNDVNRLEEFLGTTLATASNVAFMFLVTAGAMVWLDVQLAALAFLSPIVTAATNWWYSRSVEPRYESLRANVGNVNDRIRRTVAGAAVVKTYAQEERERRRVADQSAAYRDASWAVRRLKIVVGQLTSRLANVGYLTVLVVGGWWVIVGPPGPFTGSLTAGTLLTFLLLHRRFNFPTRRLPTVVDSYQAAKASAGRVLRLFDRTRAVPDADDPIELRPVRGSVVFDGVSFAYEPAETDGDVRADRSAAEPVLHDVTATVEAGETVGIVGQTGAGKSTLVKLVPRLYDPDEGRVCVDGHDVRDVSLDSLREAVGYVGQDAHLLGGTVHETVAYGVPDADRATVERAARHAGAHEFVTALPDGYDTPVGEEGVRLSGGQRQRLALARAVATDPSILLLDEATSHVDNRTELRVRERLADVTADRTTLIVAHRLSTVRDADRILVVDDGRVVERGTHEELLAADGRYADLWRVQVGAVGDVSDTLRDRA